MTAYDVLCQWGRRETEIVIDCNPVAVSSRGASRGAPHGLAALNVRNSASDALNKASGALGRVK